MRAVDRLWAHLDAPEHSTDEHKRTVALQDMLELRQERTKSAVAQLEAQARVQARVYRERKIEHH